MSGGRTAAEAHAAGWAYGWPICGAALGWAAGGGIRIQVDVRLIDLVSRLLDETVNLGYPLDHNQCGGYNCRPARSSTGASLPFGSCHSNAIAEDLNWNENGYGASHHSIPGSVVALWRAHGFVWGGEWTDYMHMEFGGSPTDAQRITAALHQTLPPPGDDMAPPTQRKIIMQPDGGPTNLVTAGPFKGLRPSVLIESGDIEASLLTRRGLDVAFRKGYQVKRVPQTWFHDLIWHATK